MRIVALKLKPATTTYLKYISDYFGVGDPDLVADVYSLIRLKGYKLPDAMVRKKIAAEEAAKNPNLSEIGLNLLLTKKVMMLEKMKTSTHGIS